jgi:galactokinase
MSRQSFQAAFGRAPSVESRAPGRVNLIGEHTDYNGGFVLPMAIPQTTEVWLAPREDQRVFAVSGNQKGTADRCEFELGQERKAGAWGDYVRGVGHILRTHGHAIRGFDAYIESRVPMGSGLSSSAALEVSLFRAIRDAFGLDLNDVRISQLSQAVENEFVGARVGIMDPMAASLCTPGSALFLDTRDLSFKQVRLADEVELVVINSGISHSNVGGDYNTRRAECEEACRLLGVAQLRELDVNGLGRLAKLPDVPARRARHVITENARVLAAVEAIEKRDWNRLGKLFGESHVSMRDDYQVSIPEIDTLVEITVAQPGIFGARLTGGGFGGSIVALAEKGEGRAIGEKVAALYRERVRHPATVLVPEASA